MTTGCPLRSRFLAGVLIGLSIVVAVLAVA
jgi:hypothetical protein